MALEVTGWIKHSEEDSYEEGCLPNTGQLVSGSDRFSAQDQSELIKQLKEFCGVDSSDAVVLNSCGEKGRIDIQTLENADGYGASVSQVNAWKRGECKLYCCDYTFNVEQVTRETFELAEN